MELFCVLQCSNSDFVEKISGFIQKGKNKIPRHFPDTNSNFPDENDRLSAKHIFAYVVIYYETIALSPVIWEYFMFYKDISPSKIC